MNLLKSLLAFSLATQSLAAWATTPVVTQVFHYLDNRSLSNTGISAGEVTVFGSFVVPNGADGTTGTAINPDYLAGAPLNLIFQSQVVGSNELSRALPASVAPRSAWLLNFMNAGDVTTVSTLDIFGATKVGFARNVSISGTTLPTLNWLPATGESFNGVRLQLYNLDQRVGNLATLFASVNLSSPAASTFTLPATLNLTAGTHYSVEISLIKTRDNTSNLAQSNLLSRSRSFFDFVLLNQPVPGPVYLPTVTPATATTPYVFSFNISGVSNTATTFIDPEIAVGYDYKLGAGDPNFATVLLPHVGDGKYDLSLWNGSAWIFSRSVQAGEVVDFGVGGVSQFRISGIETAANLSPSNATAFVTGLTFSSSGNFTGTMIPITVAVPEPATWILACIGGAVLLRVGQHRASAAKHFPGVYSS
jgi:hypothetical protein